MDEERSKNAPLTPASVGRYEVLLPIASGGMATVYLARSKGARGFERDVALKLSHPHLVAAEAPEFASVLLDEANLAAKIRHRNVVSILDVGEDPLGLFMVMDYVEGDTLGGLIRRSLKIADRGGFSVRIGMRVLLDALYGLHAAHELRDESGNLLNVVHRDFSPQNILVGLDGVSQLTDFGVAKAADRLANTATGIVKGKVSYMAPEQARGLSVDRRADVWSAGVVAWELLAEQRLFPSGGNVETLLKIVSGRPPLLRTVAPQIPREVEDVVAKALSPVETRYETAADFARELSYAFGLIARIAEPTEVGKCVEAIVGPNLIERRAQVERAIQLRAKMDALAVASIDAVAGGSVTPPDLISAGDIHVATDESINVSFDESVRRVPNPPSSGALPSPPPRSRSRSLFIVAGALLALGGLGVIFTLAFRRPAGPSAPSGVASAETSAAVMTAETTPPRPPAPIASPGADTDSVELVANAPVAILRIEKRNLAFASPTNAVTFRRSDDERGRPLKLAFVAIDGRKASATLSPAETSLHITFPAKTGSSALTGPGANSDCNPPYTVDADGVRIPKRRCF